MTNTKNSMPAKSVFRDREKEAKFWEKNAEQVLEAGKSVRVGQVRKLSESINVRLDPVTLKTVRSEASKKGIRPTQLIRIWINEQINRSVSQM